MAKGDGGDTTRRIVARGAKAAKPAAAAKPAKKNKRALTAKEVLDMEMIVAEGRVYVGIDLHKRTLQIAVVDEEGAILRESNIVNEFDAIEPFFARVPRDRAKCVVESSSVWYAVYQFIEGMGFDIILSNPLQTALIAKSKNKNDKVDARRLAELLRLVSIPSC